MVLIQIILVYSSFAFRIKVRLGAYNVNENYYSASHTDMSLVRKVFYSLNVLSSKFLYAIFVPFYKSAKFLHLNEKILLLVPDKDIGRQFLQLSA